ncbi:serine/threonine protein kinase, CMGC [Conoideocrella luteorostrata]|uniref:Serine/threonine protein kinase, CMGC n=1 Tax=Conoideocrella luteorostrata TaxID=1105319 RepID=A0AAJ0FNF7_9HYPO|nr:serine/threonine protein kinase, CMGC [Conoideocrella luteorostrata]
MNGDQSAEPEKPPPLDATDGGSSNGADSLAKKRKKDALKPIITTDSVEGDAQQNKQDSKTGCV